MPVSNNYVPQPTHHKASGQALVRLSGKDFYLGPWNSDQAKAEYNRVVGEWLARGRTWPSSAAQPLSVNELILAYLRYARTNYIRDNTPTPPWKR